jgi:hypothetical protein
MAQVVECPSSKCEVLSSKPSTAKKKRKEKKIQKWMKAVNSTKMAQY